MSSTETITVLTHKSAAKSPKWASLHNNKYTPSRFQKLYCKTNGKIIIPVRWSVSEWVNGILILYSVKFYILLILLLLLLFILTIIIFINIFIIYNVIRIIKWYPRFNEWKNNKLKRSNWD